MPFRFAVVVTALLALALRPWPAQAQTFAVGCDADPATRVTDLVAAFNAANANPGDDVISLADTCTYTLTAADNASPGILFMGQIAGNTGLPLIADAATSGALTITGNNALITRALAAPDFRLLAAVSGADVTVTDLGLTEGRANSYGGCMISLGTLRLERVSMGSCTTVYTGISNVLVGGALLSVGSATVIDSSFAGNSAADSGGAIYQSDGVATSLSVIRSTFLLNQTGTEGLREGGAIAVYSAVSISDSTFQENLAALGGAVALDQVLSKSKEISGSAFLFNQALNGGALYGGNALVVSNSTFSGNRAIAVMGETEVLFGRGGAVWSQGNLTITHSTITGNGAETEGGGVRIPNLGSVTLGHMLIAANNAPLNPDVYGNVTSQGYNLIGDSSGAVISGVTTGNLLDAAASPLNLGDLADNGGPTQTIALLPGSVALDAGDPLFAPPPTTDQRGAGFRRVQGGRVDLGAFERACPVSPVAVADGDVSGLIRAIHCANESPTDDLITLAANGSYTLLTADNTSLLTIGGNDYSADNGLPLIRSASSSGTLTLDGAGATLIRGAAAPEFRFFQIAPGGDLTLSNLTVSGGRGVRFGGAIASNGGQITLLNSTLTDNRALGSGPPRGGAIYLNNGTLTSTDTTFTLNQATLGGAVNLEANNTASFTRGLFSGNSASDSGGAVSIYASTVTVQGTVFDGNHGRLSGGALWINAYPVTIHEATFINNTTQTIEPGGGNGGAIYADSSIITLTNSTLANNSAKSGGAIVSLLTDLNVVNSTIAGNSATLSGGGISHNSGRSAGGGLILNHVTITANSAAMEGGGLANSGVAISATLRHALIAGNTAPASPDVNGSVTSQGYNLIGDSSGATLSGVTTGNLLDAAASPLNLGALADNGGPTQTIALLPGSAALDAGDPLLAAPPEYDQRGTGFPRVQGSRLDIGAFEAAAANLVVQLTLQGRSPAPHPSHVLLVQVAVFPAGGGAALHTASYVSDNSGQFTVSGLPPGELIVWVKGVRELARSAAITLEAGGGLLTTAALREGDADDNNVVTIADFALLAASFGRTSGGVGFDTRADFNADGVITISDFSLLAASFGQAGAAQP